MVGQASSTARAQGSRRTAVVEAVQKTRAGIVTIKVEKEGRDGRNRESVGTGVVVDERGYLVTNRHLVTAAARVAAVMVDGSELPARILAQDASNDLAILRVTAARKLQALPLGPGSDLLLGETVIAIGNPFGYANSVTTGIISALDREITLPSGDTLCHLIQTSAGINPGNSGGPLLNIDGELIGINVAYHKGGQGIAFAINAEVVKDILSRHLSGQNIAGVQHGLVCSERITAEGPARQHVIVARVAAETPGAAAGLQQGDEIVHVAGRSVANRFDVERALWDSKPGDEVSLTVVRQGKQLELAMTLAKGSGSATVAARKEPAAAPAQPGTPAAAADAGSHP
jgi:serine protease Do